jgi:hypothetical protein
MNTRIGFPMLYCEQGGCVLLGYLAVVLLVGIAVLVMLGTRKRETGGLLFSTISLLVGAAVLLQFIPRAETGFLFVPISPWSFASWLPFLLSLVSWASLGLAALVVLVRAVDAPAVVSDILLFSMAMQGLLSFASTNSSRSGPVVQVEPVVATIDPTMDRHQNQIAKWQAKRDEIGTILNGLVADREEIAAQLHGTTGAVRSELADELRHLDQQIGQGQRDADLLDSAIIQAESRLRRLDRQRLLEGSGVVTDREFQEISESLGELGEELR